MPAPFLSEDDITIVEDDYLWMLSEQRLATATGVEPTDRAVLDYMRTVIETNADIVEDPDLIYPGEVFTFPQIGSPPPVQPDQIEAPTLTTPTTTPPAIETPAESVVSAELAPTAEVMTDATGTQSDSVAPSVFAIAGALVAATGLIAALRALRRRREATGVVASAVGHQPTELEQILTKAANMPLLRWAGQEISMLVSQIDDTEFTGGPLAVEVTDTGIEVIWETPQPKAPHPWEAADGGTNWRLLYDADAPIPADELPAGIPALVTLGRRLDGGTVLVDLEALGSLSVSGDQAMVENTLRSFALELAASNELANVSITTVGLDVDGGEHLPRITSRTSEEALAHITAIANQYDEMTSNAGCKGSFALRAKTGVGPEAAVVIVAAEHCTTLAELIAVAKPRRGIAVVVAGDTDSSLSQLVVDDTGQAELQPWSLTVVASSMPRETASQIAVLLDEATNFEFPPVAPNDEDVWGFVFGTEEAAREPVLAGVAHEESVAGLPDSFDDTMPGEPIWSLWDLEATEQDPGWSHDDDSDAEPEGDVTSEVMSVDGEPEQAQVDETDGWVRPSGTLMVRVLGEPSVPDRPDLTAREVGLLGLLALSNGCASAERVIDHLWADQAEARTRKTLANLQTSTRNKVGIDVLPLSPKNEPVRTTAITDAQVFEALVKRAAEVSSAEAIPLLIDAMDLIEGPPFNHGQFEWARSIELYEPLRRTIEAAALHLVDLALDDGDIAAARRGASQGLLALGVNEPLYRARMRIEAHDGDQAGVLHVYGELERRLANLFDGAVPSARTQSLLDDLQQSAS